MFPKVSHLALCQNTDDIRRRMPYGMLWAYWPQVEFMEIKESHVKYSENFDEEFLGINGEEANLLDELDDEALEMMNLVPIRPCTLTMPRKIKTRSFTSIMICS